MGSNKSGAMSFSAQKSMQKSYRLRKSCKGEHCLKSVSFFVQNITVDLSSLSIYLSFQIFSEHKLM